MITIEAPSEELARELQKHLQEKRIKGSVYRGSGKTIEFPDDLGLTQRLAITATTEKWAKEKHLELVQSLKLRSESQAKAESDNTPSKEADSGTLDAEVKKRLDGLSPEKAEERYDYLSSKSLAEMTDAEFQERLQLAQRTTGKTKDRK